MICTKSSTYGLRWDANVLASAGWWLWVVDRSSEEAIYSAYRFEIIRTTTHDGPAGLLPISHEF